MLPISGANSTWTTIHSLLTSMATLSMQMLSASSQRASSRAVLSRTMLSSLSSRQTSPAIHIILCVCTAQVSGTLSGAISQLRPMALPSLVQASTTRARLQVLVQRSRTILTLPRHSSARLSSPTESSHLSLSQRRT